MALTKEEKEKAIVDFKLHKEDTGSADVQVALLSQEIQELLKHLKKNPKDHHSRRGLLKMVIKRKRLLKYLAKESKKRHNAVVEKIGLK